MIQVLVSEILSTFGYYRNEEVDEGVNDAIARLGIFCGADRAYVFQDQPCGVMANTHRWCAPGAAAEIDKLTGLPQDLLSAWVEPLAAGAIVQVPCVADLTDDREAERSLLEGLGIRSIVVFPMLNGGKKFGFVGFDAVRSRRFYGDVEINLLRSVTDAIASSLVRLNAVRQAASAHSWLAAVTRNSQEQVVVISPAGVVQWANQAAIESLGSELVGSLYWVHLEVRTREKVLQCVNGLDSIHYNCRMPQDDPLEAITLPEHVLMTCRGPRWMSASLTDLQHDDKVGALVIISQDITERRTSEYALDRRTTHDTLTGLPNRALLVARIHKSAARASGNQYRVGIIFLDIDRFKIINDGYGHCIGDRLLVAIAKRLQDSIRSQDKVARFGGDEFVVAVDQAESIAMLESFAREMQAYLSAPIKIDDREFRVSASIGITLHDGPNIDPEALIQRAELAMSKAKSNGRDRIIAYDRRIREEVERRTLIAHHLPRAVEQGAIRPAFQPIVDLRSRRLAGYEALARWADDVLGTASPAEFVPVAEELGSIRRLGASILERSLAEAGRLGGEWRMSVNLSPLQFEEPDLIDMIQDALEYSGVEPRRLCLEITESTVIKQPDKAIRTMEELRELGICLAIDDFGTGYSSLSMLRRLPVHVLKIDRSFVTDLTRSHADLQLVRAIIGIAQDFGLAVTAEGIEREQQAELLTALGCASGQGYLFGRPELLLDESSASIEPSRTFG